MWSTCTEELNSLAESSATLGVAVVGCGYWGPNLIRNFFEAPDCRVQAICDTSLSRLRALNQRHPSAFATTDFNDVLVDPLVDAVVIATPVHTHAALAKLALEAGKHVLIEKPMTSSVEDAEELVALADRLGLILMVDHTFIYTGAVRRIKELMQAGDLGRLYYYDSVRVNLGAVQHDINVIWDLAAHDLSIMNYLLDAQPYGISATAATHFPGGMADVAYLTLRFEDDLVAHFHINWLSPVKVRQILIGGGRQMVLYNDIEPTEKIKLYDRGIRWNDDPDARTEALVAYRLGDVHAPVIDQTEALQNECRHFINCIRTNTPPITDGYAGLRVVRQLAAAERSARNEGRMERLDR